MPINIFDSPQFLDALTSLLLRDADTLGKCASLISAKEMKPLSKDDAFGTYRFIIAERALNFYTANHEPIRDGILVDLTLYVRDARMSEVRAQQFLKYAKQLLTTKIFEPDKITSEVLRFKHEKLCARHVADLMELQEAGELNIAAISKATRSLEESVSGSGAHTKKKHYFDGLEDRIERRARPNYDSRYPLLYIDPFDNLVKTIGRGELGLLLAPYKRGKSLMLDWISLAYALQNLNVILVSLEDPISVVEDRVDAAIGQIKIAELANKSRLLKTRFSRFKRFTGSRLVIHDGTHEEMTVAGIEGVYMKHRNAGFIADAIVIDYDDEIVPDDASKDRRFQFADIYRGLRRAMARHNVIGWTAAQTQRGTEKLRKIGGDTVAEDISKMRKVTCAIGMGQGDWGKNSIYLYVAAHKHDRQGIGCNIMSRKSAGLIYDRQKTAREVVRSKHVDIDREEEEAE